METLQSFPDMEPERQGQFIRVIGEEVSAISHRLDSVVNQHADSLKTQWALEDMLGSDLVAAAQRRIERRVGIPTKATEVASPVWLRVDSYALIQALTYLASRLHDEFEVREVRFRFTADGRHAHLDLMWTGATMSSQTLLTWEDESMNLGGEASPLTLLAFSEDSVIGEACLGLKTSDDGSDESYKAEVILIGLGFSMQDLLRHPLDLSGGFKVRLNLAKMLVSEPDLLLLDEPTNYLDIVSIRWLTRFLKGWRGELILITHDREFMDSVTTHTMGIHRCKIRKIAGPTQKLYDQILMEEEVYELTRINEDKKRREAEQFINRIRAQATRARAPRVSRYGGQAGHGDI